MGLLSRFRKDKQESSENGGEFYSRAEADSAAASKRSRRKSGRAAEATDPALPEKKRARRRLVGAVALVLAAVIGLPMVLDSEPKPIADDISIQIPSPAKVQSSAPAPAAVMPPLPVPAVETLDKKEEVVDLPPATEAQKTAVAVLPAEQKTPDARVAEPTPADTRSAESKAADARVPPKPADKPQAAVAVPVAPPRPDAKAEAKPVEPAAKPVAVKTDDARAVALLEGKPDAATAKPASDKKDGKIVIQVAALATKEKIDELRGKLSKAGIQTYTQKVATQSGDRTRILIGPVASKEEADKVRAKLTKIGLNGTVIVRGE